MSTIWNFQALNQLGIKKNIFFPFREINIDFNGICWVLGTPSIIVYKKKHHSQKGAEYKHTHESIKKSFLNYIKWAAHTTYPNRVESILNTEKQNIGILTNNDKMIEVKNYVFLDSSSCKWKIICSY